MSDEKKRRFVGPIEEHEWPDKLKAHVVTPGPRPRIHGYDVEGDLARHYSFAETILLALTGELPGETTGRAFEIAMQFLAPISVAEAPAHAAVLARLCGAATNGVNEVAAIALSEQARFEVSECSELIDMLEDGQEHRAFVTSRDAPDRESIDRLIDRLSSIGFECPALVRCGTRTSAAVATLYNCGLRQAWQIEAVMILARLPCAVAESRFVEPGALADYPMNLPLFEYEE